MTAMTLALVSAIEPVVQIENFAFVLLSHSLTLVQASVATLFLHENTSEYCSYSYIVLRRRHTGNTLYYIKLSKNLTSIIDGFSINTFFTEKTIPKTNEVLVNVSAQSFFSL